MQRMTGVACLQPLYISRRGAFGDKFGGLQETCCRVVDAARMKPMAQPCSHIAVLADVHGNLPALEVVLGEIETTGADPIVVAGDVMTPDNVARARQSSRTQIRWDRGPRSRRAGVICRAAPAHHARRRDDVRRDGRLRSRDPRSQDRAAVRRRAHRRRSSP